MAAYPDIHTPLEAIECRGVSKAFGRIQALQDVTFCVPRHSVFCILGPNGAGKTTLLRILTTVTRPDKGSVEVEGLNIARHTLEVRQKIGIVAQENRFDRYLSVWHNLTLHAQMHGLTRTQYEPRIRNLLEQVDLYDRRNSLPDDLSGGMQRRIALIRALIHQPAILFLDEPTTGLDPQARLDIWKTIEQIKQTSTIILTTHYMDEADRLSETIMMLNQGKVVDLGTPRQLKQLLTPLNKYELVLNAPHAEAYASQLQSIASTDQPPVITSLTVPDAYRLEMTLSDPAVLSQVMSIVSGREIVYLGQKEANLEDVFLYLAAQKPEATKPVENP